MNRTFLGRLLRNSPPDAPLRAGSRNNNFDFVRLVLAVIVLLDHSFGASGSPALQILPNIFSSQLAVEGFFAISGFLIVASYERSRSLKDYASRRLRRIGPAYLAATVLALTIGFCFNRALFASRATYQFLAANLTLQNYLHPDLPGVFQHMRYAAVNGPLWTIKLEVLFYILVPLLVACVRRFGPNPVLLAASVLSILFYEWAGWSGRLTLQHQLPGQFSFFCFGALIHYHEQAFLRHKRALALAGIVVLFAANTLALLSAATSGGGRPHAARLSRIPDRSSIKDVGRSVVRDLCLPLAHPAGPGGPGLVRLAVASDTHRCHVRLPAGVAVLALR